MKLYTREVSPKGKVTYQEFGDQFSGFPMDGVWLVTDGRRSSTHIAKIDEVPDPVRLASFMRYRDKVSRYIVDERGKGVSAADLTMGILRLLEEESRG